MQTKERDEPRPRAGVLRTREFVMKDAYSFDRDVEGLERSYERHIEAYDRIFDRCGLRWYRVESDVGMMGGLGAHEYMAPCAAGEDEVALAPGYAANVEVASADPQPVELPAALAEPQEVQTPGLTTVEEVVERRSVFRAGALLKAMPVIVEERGMVLVAGARRPPPQRAEAAQRSRRRLSTRARGGDRDAARAGGVRRPGRRRDAGDQGRRDRGRGLRRPAPTGPTPT